MSICENCEKLAYELGQIKNAHKAAQTYAQSLEIKLAELQAEYDFLHAKLAYLEQRNIIHESSKRIDRKLD